MPPESSSTEPSIRLLRRLFKGLERRPALEGAGRIELDRQILGTLKELAESERQETIEWQDEVPPRAISVSMAIALFAQPHLAVMLGDLTPSGSEDLGRIPDLQRETPFVIPPEILQEALGLPGWELEELREDVDRRVGTVLKQTRVLRSLWDHFGLDGSSPEQLFRVLFPSAPGRLSGIGMLRRGAHLYAVVGQDAPPPLEALYLPWLQVDEDRTYHPLRAFGGRYVNGNLRRALARSVGASDDETIDLLDRMVTIVPRSAGAAFLAHDSWRARGLAAITDVPASGYAAAAWLVRPLDPSDVSVAGWLQPRPDGTFDLKDARTAFDILAVTRVNEVLRHLYGQILATLQLEDPSTDAAATVGDLLVLDLERHLRAVLKPLLDWAAAPQTVSALAPQMNVAPEALAAAFEEVSRLWSEQLEYGWLAGPQEGQARSVRTLLAAHLVATTDSLRRMLRRPADPRAPHRDVLLTFAAVYLASSPLERLWAEASENATWPATRVHTNDFVSQWFWGAWTRVLDTIDAEVTVP